MYDYLHTARLAAGQAAAIIKSWQGRNFQVAEKAPADQVTQVDLEAQAAIISLIKERHPAHVVLAEEGQGSYSLLEDPDAYIWVIDPLDGTTNFIHGFPMAAVSVALLRNKKPLLGVVRHAFMEEEFWAMAGQGAWLNAMPLRVSQCADPVHALCATAFPFRYRQLMPRYLELFARMLAAVEDVRRGGAAALDLAYVAAGRVDAYWELGLKPWDMAAGMLLVREAGGLVSDFDGGDRHLIRGDVLAANPYLHNELRQFTSTWWRE